MRTFKFQAYTAAASPLALAHTQIGSADGEIGLKIKFFRKKIFAAGTNDSEDYSVLCYAHVLSLLVVVAG